LSVSCGGTGQQWTAAGAGALGGINGDHSKRIYAMPKSIVPRAPAPAAVHC